MGKMTDEASCFDEPGTHAPAFDKGSRRMLDLLFLLNAAPGPISSDDILSNGDIGYGSGNRDSDRRKFARDRKKLAEHGVVITEVRSPYKPETEQSVWQIDREHTHAATGSITPDDAHVMLAAIEETFHLHADDPLQWPLQRACVKLREIAGLPLDDADSSADGLAADHAVDGRRATMRAVWSALDARLPVTIMYRDAKGGERERTIETYGVFSMGSNNYIVGNDTALGELRTFRTDRIVSAKMSAASRGTYEIPADFSIDEHRFLPFDFSSAEPVSCMFSFTKEAGAPEVEAITHGRGDCRRSVDGSWLWTVDVRDIDAAARWALSLSSHGMRAVAPEELTRKVHALIEKAVMAHA